MHRPTLQNDHNKEKEGVCKCTPVLHLEYQIVLEMKTDDKSVPDKKVPVVYRLRYPHIGELYFVCLNDVPRELRSGINTTPHTPQREPLHNQSVI